MALDKNYIGLEEALNAARNYHDKKTFDHAVRVMKYVSANSAIPEKYKHDCLCLALMHDLLEDTEYNPKYLPKNFRKALDLLTKPDDMNYNDYCKRLHYYTYKNYGKCAWFVKLADMKDHLNQAETLTPHLKEKYLSGLRYLL